jgi:hypothetical protein
MFSNIIPMFGITNTISDGDCAEIEGAIGVTFPGDLRAFLKWFGPGNFCLQPTDSEGSIEVYDKDRLILRNSDAGISSHSPDFFNRYENVEDVLALSSFNDVVFFARDLSQDQEFAFHTSGETRYMEFPKKIPESIN